MSEQTIQQINHELTEVKHEKLSLLQQSQQSNFENTNLITQLQKLETQHESMTKHLADTLNELARQTQTKQLWQEQFEVLQNKYDEQNQSFVDLKTQYATLLQQSETMKIEIQALHEQNKLLAHEKWELGQEKAQLYGQLKQLDSSSKAMNTN